MAFGGAPPSGRERRRTDPIGRIRRFLYGLLLLAAAPGALAADELASIGKYRAHSVAQSPQAALATLQGLLVLRAGQDDGPEVSLDTATAQVPQQRGEQVPQFRIAASRSAGPEGVAFDLPVSDLGEFQLKLKTERSAAFSAWSLGGTLELMATASRRRHVAAIPTLRINDMHGREVRYLAFDASLTQGAAGQDPQLAFSWRI
jgi:hypothetical protein